MSVVGGPSLESKEKLDPCSSNAYVICWSLLGSIDDDDDDDGEGREANAEAAVFRPRHVSGIKTRRRRRRRPDPAEANCLPAGDLLPTGRARPADASCHKLFSAG